MASFAEIKTYVGPGFKKPVAEGVLLGFGNPLLDISAEIPAELLTKYELKSGDIILADEKHQPIYSELVENFKVDYIAGGATQNAIRVAQWMLQSKNATAFIGCVGKDSYAEELNRCCMQDGVHTHYLVTEDAPTGTCAVLVYEKERTLIANLGAANLYKHAHTQSAEMQQVITRAQVIYCSGFPLSTPEGKETMLSMCKHAAEHNKPFCLNLSAPFLIQFFWEKIQEVLFHADYLFGNESEAAEFSKKQGWECDLPEVALRIAAMAKASGSRCRTVIITQGAEKTVVARNGEVTLYPVPKLEKEYIVDTNGAGDAFVGGFLARLTQGYAVEECVRAGHYAARIIIQQSGVSLPPAPDVA